MNSLRTITVTGSPPWLPAMFRGREADVRIEVRFTKPERKVLRKKRLIPVSEWAEKSLVLTDGPLKGGFWRRDMAPWSVGMMDASFFPSVRKIVNCKSVQSTGSTVVNACLAYAMDRKPGDAMIIMPNRDAARKRVQDRLIKIIEQSPVLRKLLTGKEDDKASFRIRLLHMLVYAGWAGSPTSLGDSPCMYVIKDEADKWIESDTSKQEASSHKLADKRVTTFQHDSKIWDNSTPTTEAGHIWQALLTETQIISSYWVRCPECSTMQVMIAKQIKWEGGKEADPVDVEAGKQARYACHECGALWDDYRRDMAVKDGEWRALPTAGWEEKLERLKKGDHSAMAAAVELFACLRATRPASIGFHTPAWISSFVSLSRSAAAIIRAASKGIDEVKDLATNYAAEPWREYRQKREDDKILLLQDDRPRGMVPGGNMVACLVAGVDTQDTGFYYKIIAVGYGQVQNIWVVQYGFVLDFEALEKVLWWHTYKDASGRDYPVQLVLQDAMGHRTADVYDFCRKYKGYIFPSKGERTKAQRFSYSNMEFYPGTKKAIPGGLQLVSVNTTYYKNALGNKLNVEPSDPGAIRLHSETDADYASQMTAEYRDAETGTWECPPSRANHYWDCMVLALVAADILDVKKWPTPEEVAAGPEEYVKSQSSYIKR